MGCSFSSKEVDFVKTTLRSSLIGNYFQSELDLLDFLNLSTILTIKQDQIVDIFDSKLMVILNGSISVNIVSMVNSSQVQIQSRKGTKKSFFDQYEYIGEQTTTVFTAGDLILLPITDQTLITPLILDSLYSTGKVKISFSTCEKGKSEVYEKVVLLKIGIENFRKFTRTRTYTCQLTNMIRFSLASCMHGISTLVKGLSVSQINILGPMLKIIHIPKRTALQLETSVAVKKNCLSISQKYNDYENYDDPAVMIILMGSCVQLSSEKVLNSDTIFSTIYSHLTGERGGNKNNAKNIPLNALNNNSFNSYSTSIRSLQYGDDKDISNRLESCNNNKNNTRINPKLSGSNSCFQTLNKSLSLIRIQNNKIEADPPNDNTVYKEIGQIMQPGCCFRQESVFLEVKEIIFETIVTQEDCLIGILSKDAITKLGRLDVHLIDTMRVNFNFEILKKIQNKVSLFRDMTDAYLHLFAAKIKVDSYSVKEEIVYNENINESKKQLKKNIKSPEVEFFNDESYEYIGGYLEVGHYYGEMSLIQSPKPELQANRIDGSPSISLIAQDATVILSIDGIAFNSIFDSNPNYLADLRVRLSGKNVDLSHVISHPFGYASFLKFLQLEFSSEGLLFWKEAKAYEDMCSKSELLIKTMILEEKNLQDYDRSSSDDDDNCSETSAESDAIEDISNQNYGSKHISSEQLNANQLVKNVKSNIQSKTNRKHSLLIENVPESKEVDISKLAIANKSIESIDMTMKIVINTFILQNSRSQVNIPAAIQAQIQNKSSQLTVTYLKICDKMYRPYSLLTHLQELSNLVDEYKLIFAKCVYEVYSLLKKDGFMRYKKTEEFDVFLKRLKPFNHRRSSVSSLFV